jgi:amino acid transporter
MNGTPTKHPARHLERRFGLLQSTALNMSNMVGIGPFITIPVLMTSMGGPQAMLGWIVALVVAMADGLVWSELGAARPGSGGSYVYLLEAFGRLRLGRLMAFLFIWQFILSGPLEIASGYIGFAQYFQYLWPGLSSTEALLVAGAVGVLNIFLLYRQITSIGRITVSLWIGTLLTAGAVIVTGVAHFDPQLAFHFPPDAFHFSSGFLMGLGAASRVGVYDYLGYYDVCFIGDEVKDPGRVIPRSILISLVGVAALYVLINLSIIGIVPWQSFVPAGDPPAPVVSLLMEKIYGANVAKIFTVMVLWTAFGSCFALLLGYSRIPFAAARDGNFFRVFSRLHPTQNFPHVSLVVIGVLAVICTFLPLMTVIDALLTTRILVQFIGQAAAVILLRRTQPDLERPFRMWFYPLPALVALLGWLFLFSTTDPKQLAYAVGVLIAGLACFFAWAKQTKRWPFEPAIA